MPTYAALVDVREGEAENVQRLATLWTDVQAEVEEVDGELLDAYALLGRHDYLLILDVPDRGAALQAALTVERHGLDMETMDAIPVSELGELVEDL
jgi:uncharacterized protein with GYD domain